MTEAITLGVISGLLTTAIARIGSIPFQKIIRRNNIASAIKSGIRKNNSLKIAITDFEIVMGSYSGELTQNLDNFLNEIKTSGLITVLAENSILKTHSVSTKAAFIDLYGSFIKEDTERAEELYNKIYTSFSVTFDHLIQDDSLAFLLRSIHKSLQLRLDGIEQTLSSISAKRPHFLGYDDQIEEVLGRLSKGLASRYKTIRVETNKGQRPVDIKRIFIPSKMKTTESSFPFEVEEIIPTHRKFSARRKTHSYTADFMEHVDLDTVNYNDLLKGFRRVIILGDPGGGKTTLCQHLCYEFAKASSIGYQHDAKKQIDQNIQRIPIRIVLRSFDSARISEPQLGLVSFIARDLSNVAALPKNVLEKSVIYLLSIGKGVLIFDGLDEILNIGRRREFVELVDDFANQFPLCPVVVTSRKVGYNEAPLPDDFEPLVLERFDDREVENYVQKFMRVVANETAKVAKENAEKFLRETERNAKDLRENPLLLGLMSWLFFMKGDVPANRPEIYKECAELMFEKWDPKRGIKYEKPGDFDLLQLLTHLASEIYGKAELENGVDKEWLGRKVKGYFEKIYENRARATESGKILVDFITDRAWVMSEIGPNKYKVTHRTFLEYFFSLHLDDIHDTMDALFKALRPRILRNEWEVISHLSVQIKAFRSPRRTEQALTSIHEILGLKKLSIKRRAAATSFAAKSLEYLPGSEKHFRLLVESICDNAFRLGPGKAREIFGILAQCCNCCRERRNISEIAVSDYFIAAIKSKRPEVAYLSASLISSDDALFQISDSRDALRLIPRRVYERSREALKGIVSLRSGKEPFYALLYWEWYGENFDILFRRYGLGMLLDDRRPLIGRMPLYGATKYVLLSSQRGLGVSGSSIFSREKVDLALEKIGQIAPGLIPFSVPASAPEYNYSILTVEMWADLLEEYEKHPRLLGGFITLMLASLEIHVYVLRSGMLMRRAGSRRRAVLNTMADLKGSDLYKRLERLSRNSRICKSANLEFVSDWLHEKQRIVIAP